MTMNRLAHERSSYLRHAADQVIDWYPWSDEAFDKARRKNKPVFVSSGAIWCHWCHVMAQESFRDPETAKLLNDRFISIKLDRDERPDLDRRLQLAVAAMGSGSGWPLSVFLTPEKRVFYGGTYFPPDDREGRPAFRKVLNAVFLHYTTRRDDVVSFAASLEAALKSEPLEQEAVRPEMLDQAEEAMLSQFDAVNGGFGHAPKFPMTGAVEFLLRRFSQGRQAAGDAARTILSAMARGGIHDHLGGGFHRYSVDEAWIIPHFEKMADDNAGLLRNYSEAYALFGNEAFRSAAYGIVQFTQRDLADPAGGFYASQDADVTPDDEGGYFTWTDEELRSVLGQEAYETFALHLVPSHGSVHHDPSKRVLAVNREPADISALTGRSPEAVTETIRRAKAVLFERRSTRTAPFIDRALYASLNGMMIAAYFRASLVFADDSLADTAARSLERVLERNYRDGQLYHADTVPALLEDYVHVIDALITGYEATGRQEYADQAADLMSVCRSKLFDQREGGFFDTEQAVLGTRLKRIEDTPHPSPNAVAIMLLLKLSLLTGKNGYREDAERSLRAFAGQAANLGVHAGSYFCALALFTHMRLLTVEAAPGTGLAREARFSSAASYALLRYGQDRNRVIACVNGVCSTPRSDARDLFSVR